jgi:hypothetical protein
MAAPTGVAVDDLIFLIVNHDSENQSFTWPSGFTELFTGGWRFENAVAYKIADAGDAAASTFTVSWTNSSTVPAIAIRVSGVDTSAPINVHAKATAGSNAYTAPSVTTTVDDCLIITGMGRDDAASFTVPTGTTLIQESTANNSLACAEKDHATAGATGTFVWNNSANEEMAWTIAVAPESTDTTPPVLTSPTGTKTGSTTADGTVITDEGNGTLYYLASTNATETAATIKTGSSQAVTATGSQAVSFTGLTASTLYYAHYVHDDAASNESNVVVSASFTTDASAGVIFSRSSAGFRAGSRQMQ